MRADHANHIRVLQCALASPMSLEKEELLHRYQAALGSVLFWAGYRGTQEAPVPVSGKAGSSKDAPRNP